MSVNWDSYTAFQPLEDGPMEDMTPDAAWREYEHRMATKDERLAVLSGLLEANGLRLGADDESLDALERWYKSNVEPDAAVTGRPRPLWIAVGYDLGLHLGDVIVSRAPGLAWTFYRSIKGAQDVAHQHPVIMGFTNLKNKRYNVDPFLFAVGVGGSHLRNPSGREGEFRNFVDSAVSYA